MAHDFVAFPELTNAQMRLYYHDSPHRQIIDDDFRAKVIKVHDGDTITLRWHGRDFDFPLRFIDIAAPELKEKGGKTSQNWLEKLILGKMIDVEMDVRLRVEKWGRLMGRPTIDGLDIGEMSMQNGHAVAWEERKLGSIPDFDKEMKKHGV